MNIVVISAFRNMAGRIKRYMRQVDELRNSLPADHVRVVAVEGDSVDRTASILKEYPYMTVVTHNHNQRVFGSTEAPERLKALTGVMMAGWGGVRDDDDVLLYVESDLLWSADEVAPLLESASGRRDGYDIVAPLVFAGDYFYDVWGFRKDGVRFSPIPPFHADLATTGITEVDSVGSCFAVGAQLAAKVSPVGEEALVSWCRGAKELGLRIGVAAEHRIHHPC
jgi:hypothetical protein